MAVFSTLPFRGKLRLRQGIPQAMIGNDSPFGVPVLPENYGFNELAGYEESRRKQFGQEAQDRIAKLRSDIQSQYDTNLNNFRTKTDQRRQALASSLGDTAKRQFDLQNPGILEDLNRRGFLSSPTEVANAQAQAQKELALNTDRRLADFDTESRGYEDVLNKERLAALNELDAAGTSAGLQANQDALDSALDLRRGNLEQRFQANQAAGEEALARDLAKQQGRNSLIGSLIGAGGNIIGGSLLNRGGGGLFGGGAGGGGAGLGSFLTGGASTPLGRVFGAKGPTASSSVVGGGKPFGVKPAGPGLGSYAAGAGLGLAGAGLGRNVFGGGNDLGGLAGGVLGFGLGGPLGAGIGSFLGTGVQRLGEKGYEAAKKSIGNTAASVIKPIVNPVGAVKSVAKSIKKSFCFDANTMIDMEDGSHVPVSQLYLGAETKGGVVESIRTSKVDEGERYNYRGIHVTGSHAVKESEKWIRVEDSEHSIPRKGGGVVWSIATDKHRVWIDGIEFADELEHDNWEDLTMDQSLEELNKKEKVKEYAA